MDDSAKKISTVASNQREAQLVISSQFLAPNLTGTTDTLYFLLVDHTEGTLNGSDFRSLWCDCPHPKEARAHPPWSTEEQEVSALAVSEQREAHHARCPIKCEEVPTRSLCRISGRQGHLETDILTHLTVVQKRKTREDERILFPPTSLTGRLVNSPGGRDEFLPLGHTHAVGSGTRWLKLGLKSYAKTFVHGQILSPSLTQFPYPRKWKK